MEGNAERSSWLEVCNVHSQTMLVSQLDAHLGSVDCIRILAYLPGDAASPFDCCEKVRVLVPFIIEKPGAVEDMGKVPGHVVEHLRVGTNPLTPRKSVSLMHCKSKPSIV